MNTQTCLYLPADLLKSLDDLARASGRSRSNAARRILQVALADAGLMRPIPSQIPLKETQE